MVDPFADFESRLDHALVVFGHTNATFAALFGQNGQQLVQNWRARGRIGHPSHRSIRQQIPGFPLEWVNDNTGDVPIRQVARVLEPFAPSYALSQAQRPDPAILAKTQQFLDRAFADSGRVFSLVSDPDLFADAYEWLAEDERPVDQRNLVDFVRWRATKQQADEADDDEQDRRATGKASGTDRGRAAG